MDVVLPCQKILRMFSRGRRTLLGETRPEETRLSWELPLARELGIVDAETAPTPVKQGPG